MVGNDREGTEKTGRVAATTPVNRRKNNSNNAVLSTIPLYTLSLYRMPAWLQTQIIRKFPLNGLGMGRKGYHGGMGSSVQGKEKRVRHQKIGKDEHLITFETVVETCLRTKSQSQEC